MSRWILAVLIAWEDVHIMATLLLLVCSANAHQRPIIEDEDKRRDSIS